MLPAWGALDTDEKSPIFRYAQARLLHHRQGRGRSGTMKIQTNALDLLKPEEVLKALKDSGAS